MHQSNVVVPAQPTVPADVLKRFHGAVEASLVRAWGEIDLDSNNKYLQQSVVVSDTELLVTDGKSITRWPILGMSSAETSEGLGIDRLVIQSDGKLLTELRYTRSCRRDMTRLQRKLARRIGKKDPAEIDPAWLETAERETEKLDLCPKCGHIIPSYAEGVCPRCLQKKTILWRMLDVGKPYRKQIAAGIVFTTLMSGVSVLPPWINKHLIDDGLASLNTRALLFWGAMMAIAIVAMEILGGLRVYTLAKVGTNLTRDLRHAVYAHMHELSLRFFAKRRTGSLITRVTNDTDRLWDFIVFGAVDFLRNIMMVAFIASVMFWINWKLALISLIPLPIIAVLTYIRTKTLHRMWGRLWTYWSRMGAVVGDAIPGVKVVKAFANETKEVKRFDRRSDEYTDKEQEIHKAWTTLGPAVGATMRLGGVLVWMIGGWLTIKHRNMEPYTLGTLIAFTAYLWQFYQPIMELVNSNRMVTRAATSAQRVFEVLDTPPEIYSRTDALTKDRIEGRVEFRGVSFSYEGATPALREVSLGVEPGKMIGLCGPSGAGKSTFVNLLCRFYDVTDGQLLIDGVDIRDYDVKWLRRQIGMVLQEPFLFHGTVAENIRYGNSDATEAEIIRAAKAANAHDFIVGFPDGYDTMVGERGQSLSGGERQRISIARAILHNPRILILDEATSSLDTETEKQIQQALDRLVEGRTTFAIAHRLSTLQAAQKLIVLEKGKVVEEGTHSELVNKDGGVYSKLYKTQMEMNQQMALR